MSLSTEELIKLISGNVLNATEVKVYECVINWVKHRLNDRSDSLPILMEYVRLPLVSLEYISNNVVKEPLFKNLPKSKDYLIEAYQFHALKTQQIETIPQTIRNTPRMSGQKVIIMIEYAHSDCWYDPTTNKWHILNTKCNHTLSYVDFDRSALIKDQYVVSYSYPELRIIGFRIKSSCKTYFLLTSVPRRNFGFCVLDHNLYAVGGSGKGGYLTSSEVFDLNNFNDRRMIANMSTKRSNLGVGVLNGLLYAVGGITNDSMQLKSVECYDPKLDTWTPVAEMRACRYDVGVGQMDGVLYAVGGKYGNRCLSSVEAYNPSTGVWTSIANMHKARSGSSVFAIDGLLYVIGGYDGRYPGVGISIITNRKVAPAKQLNSVEIYNPDTNSWSIKNMSWKMNDILGGIIVDKALFRKWKEP